ncbi:hypothetical protein [Pleionea sediminis]|uniref:hypothetical protein n=1 Tax=Pleionea sediminis TaxID=2569479 RepID=UPI001185AEE1|nr:hypothetical protein [Pleionea sediminis]
MSNKKHIEEITVEDLQAHRWCFYQSENDDQNLIEYVISEEHPEFSEEGIELELAEFHFANGKVALGLYDGFEAFNIMTPTDWYSFWYGVEKPEQEDVLRLQSYLKQEELELPVKAIAKWSKIERTYHGIQYINSEGEAEEIRI